MSPWFCALWFLGGLALLVALGDRRGGLVAVQAIWLGVLIPTALTVMITEVEAVREYTRAAPFAMLVWFTAGVLLLVAIERTRLPFLYVLKTGWVSFTILAFLWVIITSMGTSLDFVQRPGRALSQFLDPGEPLMLLSGVGALGLVVVVALLGRWRGWSKAQGSRLGNRVPLVLRIACGTGALALLLGAAHANGYNDWGINYARAWTISRMGDYMVNSAMISVGAVGLIMVCASMAAYALTRLQFTGRDSLLYMFIAGLAIPGQLILVPLFLMLRDWRIEALDFAFMDSRFGLTMIYAAMSLPFTIFLLTGFFRSLPGELAESAAIDGCGDYTTFSRIYFPLAAPGLTTAAIFNFVGIWNEYNFALVFITNPDLKTLPVGLYYLTVTQQYAAEWPALFAGIVILFAPTFAIFLVLQRQIIAGLTLGSVKG